MVFKTTFAFWCWEALFVNVSSCPSGARLIRLAYKFLSQAFQLCWVEAHKRQMKHSEANLSKAGTDPLNSRKSSRMFCPRRGAWNEMQKLHVDVSLTIATTRESFQESSSHLLSSQVLVLRLRNRVLPSSAAIAVINGFSIKIILIEKPAFANLSDFSER